MNKLLLGSIPCKTKSITTVTFDKFRKSMHNIKAISIQMHPYCMFSHQFFSNKNGCNGNPKKFFFFLISNPKKNICQPLTTFRFNLERYKKDVGGGRQPGN
jgi:hypothetical protein